jgi:hypothetical protein
MKPRVRDDEEDEELPDAQPELENPPVAYRVAGDVQARAAELELKVHEMKREMRALEREVYAARKTLRARAAIRATSIGGLGALAGAILGAFVYALADAPSAIVIGAVLGFVFGSLGGATWNPPDDNFPPAPPPRMY